MPVGYDRDGAVAGLYRVGGCPTFAYAYPGGTLQSASIGELSARRARRASRRAAARDRAPRKAAEWAGEQATALGPRLGAVPEQGWVAPHVAAEFPGLAIAWIEVDGRPGRSPEPVRRRLRDLSDRFYGAHAIHMRERPIPWAYRVFFRQIGLDPDRTRTPVEQLALDRLHDGAFKQPRPARRRAHDRDRRDRRRAARLRRRPARGAGSASATPRRGRRWPGRPGELAQGTLTIADEERPPALLFGATAEGRAVTRHAADRDRRGAGQGGPPDRRRRGALDRPRRSPR